MNGKAVARILSQMRRISMGWLHSTVCMPVQFKMVPKKQLAYKK